MSVCAKRILAVMLTIVFSMSCLAVMADEESGFKIMTALEEETGITEEDEETGITEEDEETEITEENEESEITEEDEESKENEEDEAGIFKEDEETGIIEDAAGEVGIPGVVETATYELETFAVTDAEKIIQISITEKDALAFTIGDTFATAPKLLVEFEFEVSDDLGYLVSGGMNNSPVKLSITGDNADKFTFYSAYTGGSVTYYTAEGRDYASANAYRQSENPYVYNGDVYLGVADGAAAIAAGDTATITVSANEQGSAITDTADIIIATGDEQLTELSLNGEFYDQAYYQGYGPIFYHEDTKSTVEDDGYFRQRLQAVKKPYYSNEQVIWSIEGTSSDPAIAAAAAAKYELYDARTGGNVVNFDAATAVTDVYMSVKANETISARGSADEVVVTVKSARDPVLTDSVTVRVRAADMSTIYGDFMVYDGGSTRNLSDDETAFIYVVDTEYKSEPQFREIRASADPFMPTMYELNLDNTLAEHMLHASVGEMLLLTPDETGIEQANTRILTPYDYKEQINDPGASTGPNPFDFAFVKMPKVSGRVVDQNGAPIAGAWIFGGEPCETGADGTFTTTMFMESFDEPRELSIGAYKEGYEYGFGTFHTGTITVAGLKAGVALNLTGDIVLANPAPSSPFSDSGKNSLRLYPGEISSGQYATAYAYVHSAAAIPDALVSIGASADTPLKDANGKMYVYELPSYSMVSISGCTYDSVTNKISFYMPFKADTEYMFSFGVAGPELGLTPKINEMYQISVTASDGVNNYNVCNNVLTVNDLTIQCPTEIGIDDMLNVYGKAAAKSGVAVKLEVEDIYTGETVASSQQSAQEGQFLYSFEGVNWSDKKPGVYEVKVSLLNGSTEVAAVTRTLLVTPAPIKVISASFYDNATPRITVPNPPANLVFPTHVWMLDEWNLYDTRKPYTLEVELESETREIAGELGGEIVGVNIAVETRFGTYRYNTTSGDGRLFTANIYTLAGVGVSAVFAEVLQKSYSDPREYIIVREKVMNLSQIVDPSGYVYDTKTGRRIQGATATLYYKNNAGAWVVWDAENYQQINPQQTDSDGKYGWMVPEGEYEVRVSKTGYRDYTTLSDSKYGVITVLPARTDINIGLTSASQSSGSSDGDSPDSGSTRSGSSGGGSTSTTTSQTTSTTTLEPTNTASENQAAVESLLESGSEIVVVLTEKNDTITLNAATVDALVNAGQPLTITQGGTTLTITPDILASLEITGGNIQISMAPLSNDIVDELVAAALASGSGDISLAAEVLDITVMVDGKEIKNFAQPLEISIDITASGLAKGQIEKLSGARLNDDGTINKLGGYYNENTKKFSFFTSKLSMYSVIVAEDLVSLYMTLNSGSYMLNNANRSLDVPPVIKEGRTLVPVRLIAESFGAKVDWNDVTKTVTINLDGRSLSLTIGQKLTGMDVAPMIIDDRTMVPLRFISEYFDANVVYDDMAKSISIYR